MLELGWPTSWEIGRERIARGAGLDIEKPIWGVLSWCQYVRSIEHCRHPSCGDSQGESWPEICKVTALFTVQSFINKRKGHLNRWPLQPCKCKLRQGITKNKTEWKNKYLYRTISEHLALPSSSPEDQESYPLFPLKYTLSQFPHQMGTLFNYWGFFAMLIMGTA